MGESGRSAVRKFVMISAFCQNDNESRLFFCYAHPSGHRHVNMLFRGCLLVCLLASLFACLFACFLFCSRQHMFICYMNQLDLRSCGTDKSPLGLPCYAGPDKSPLKPSMLRRSREPLTNHIQMQNQTPAMSSR